jgi:nitrogen fixation protein NifU and related proteins
LIDKVTSYSHFGTIRNMPSDALYQARILDHYKHPRNKREMSDADVVKRASNPSCGDTLTLYVRFEGEALVDVSFVGEGCAVSQASASLLTEKLRGMTKSDACALTVEDIFAMLGVPISPGREKCALLAWGALQGGVCVH